MCTTAKTTEMQVETNTDVAYDSLQLQITFHKWGRLLPALHL